MPTPAVPTQPPDPRGDREHPRQPCESRPSRTAVRGSRSALIAMNRPRNRRRSPVRRPRYRPGFDVLERRDVPSALSGVAVFTDAEPNDVITAPQQLGVIDPGQGAQVYGAVGNNAYGGAD